MIRMFIGAVSFLFAVLLLIALCSVFVSQYGSVMGVLFGVGVFAVAGAITWAKSLP